MARAKTLTGLFFQFFRMRWEALGKRGKLLLLAGLALASVAAFHVGTCYLSGCAASNAPCDIPCSTEAVDEDAPCPYAARAAAEQAAAEQAAADVPPCQRR